MVYSSLEIQRRLADNSVDTGRKLNAHKTFRRRPRRLPNSYVLLVYVLCLRGEYARSFFALSEKKRLTNLTIFTPVCILLAQLASMDVFYSIWQKVDIVFYKKPSWVFLNCHPVAFFEANVLKEVHIYTLPSY